MKNDEELPRSEWTDHEIFFMWPQAKGELTAFANVLTRGGNAGITAAQLRMAILLAERAYSQLSKST
jgi:hypothetical protein